MIRRLLASTVMALLTSSNGIAQTIIDDWQKVKVPPPPELRSVTLDPGSTALLLLDFNGHEDGGSGPCNAANKPRCLASIPKVKELLEKARAKGLLVVYSLGGQGVPADIQPALAPLPGEAIVKSGPDKFIGTDLREILAKRGVKTAIVTGTAAEGAVLDTATDAALHGMAIVVPIDGMSSTERYAEQYVAWHLTHAPGVSQKTTLTRIDMVAF